MDLKNILKTLKLNESNISMVLGAVVVLVAGIFVFNYFRGRNSGIITPSISTESSESPAVGKTYTVLKGDTLWKIAEKAYGSGYNFTDLIKENKLAANGAISEGQVLTIPDVQPKKLTTNEISKFNVDQPISGGSYTVVKGDSLWTIAVRAYGDGYKWTQLAKDNNLRNPSLIHPGNVLTLPR